MIRRELFEALGRIGDIADVLRAINVSAKLAAEKLEKVGAALAKLAVRIGKADTTEE
jgi:hypothetical protein